MVKPVPLSPESLETAARLLRDGKLVAFPTETVYGLGADATNERAVAAIFEAKGRPSFNPLICHVPDRQTALDLVEPTPLARKLAEAFWPGPLTLVMTAREDRGLSKLARAGLPSVALRVPAHAGARDLLKAVGRPIAAPSANPSGKVSATTAKHVEDGLGARLAMILDGGATAVGLESTVIDATGERAVILRPGGISQDQVEAVVGPVTGAEDPDRPLSPGQLLSHYAPGPELRLEAEDVRPGEALLAFGPPLETHGPVLNLSEAGDLQQAAANLFSHLHALDRPEIATIAVMPIPDRGLGLAINDRLRRAAAPRPK